MSGLGEGALRRGFDESGGFTVGVEEETWLLDPETLDLAPVAAEVLVALSADTRFAGELPAAQLEIITTPAASAADAVDQLTQARCDLAAAAAGLAVPAVCAVHPTTSGLGTLSDGSRYETIRRRYGTIAKRQLVASLQIHVAVGGATRSLAVYNTLRGYLPEIAALAANAPYYEGADSGLASVRPGICVLLPRQGVPPHLSSWEHLAAELRWGVEATSLADSSQWWWELRPHPRYGTLEVRVPDAQTTLDEAAGLIAFVQALVAMLAARYDDGMPGLEIPTWRIQENRFSALRHGTEGDLADLSSGRARPTRERLLSLVDEVEPAAEKLGSASLLRHTRALIARNGSARQREACVASGVEGLPSWLAARYLQEPER
ncbi:MAG: YbdK family carboxylate-amine ligase [Solirubrobacterales bacterium]|nr:YbdK family carboxylate-amine ligase [Solirubrobacterales bacterium]